MCPLYVVDPIGPGDRKSAEAMVTGLVPGDSVPLHHVISSGIWDEAPLEGDLAVQAEMLIGGAPAILVIDATALAKIRITFGRGRIAIPLVARQERPLPDAGARQSSRDDHSETRNKNPQSDSCASVL